MTDRSRLGPEEPAAGALGRLMRESGRRYAGSTTDPELERLLRALSSVSPNRAPRRGVRAWASVAAAAAILGIVGSFAWRKHEGAALTFAANGVRHEGPAAIAADSGHAVDVRFSDGSAFSVEPAARLRVDSSSASGARLTLVEGKTTAHVVHRSTSNWSVTAGPFEVRVTGTRFDARWDATNQRLSVALYEGSVQVVGGGFKAPIAVRAGERLEAGKGLGNWLLTSLEAPDGTPRGVRTAPSVSTMAVENAPPAAPAPNVTATSSAVRAPSPAFDWPALLGRADFDTIVRQANDLGIERCLSTCAPSDLRVLADAARYLGRNELAERSLLALRKRSPLDSAGAAFLLARLAESRDPEAALGWYEKSFDEAPGGAYASEALGGKMRLLLRQGGSSAAARAAEQYLERFAGGIHAEKAREILSRARPPSDRH